LWPCELILEINPRLPPDKDANPTTALFCLSCN
jgi:hypothetical protein